MMAQLPRYHEWHSQFSPKHKCDTHGLYPVGKLTAFSLAVIYVDHKGGNGMIPGRWFVFETSDYASKTIANGTCESLEEGKLAIYRAIAKHHKRLAITVI